MWYNVFMKETTGNSNNGKRQRLGTIRAQPIDYKEYMSRMFPLLLDIDGFEDVNEIGFIEYALTKVRNGKEEI